MTPQIPTHDPEAITALAARIRPLDDEAMDAARARWDRRAKPPGSLGRLEDVAVRVAGITGQCPPALLEHPDVVVFAGDHGAVADGASAWPSEVTAMMVATMVNGSAAINALATTVGATVTVVDVGVAADLDQLDRVLHAKVRPGTDSIAWGPAMTRAEAELALLVGVTATADRIAAGADLLVAGDMGIGNTTPSAALIAHFSGAPVDGLVGPGAGLPTERLGTKAAIVAAAVERAAALDEPVDPIAVLAEIGGLELAALAGCYLAAAAAGVPVVVDGVIALAALCVADALAPGTAARTIAGHRSSEPAATVALAHLDAVPLLDLDLRLGEGTGACLAVPLVQAAVRALRDMADLPA